MDFQLSNNHKIVDAWVIFQDETKQQLQEMPDRQYEKSTCLFFSPITHDNFRIQLRLDYSSLDQNGDPKLDADIFKDGKKYYANKSQWHHTPKTNVNGIFKYLWKLDTEELKIPEFSFLIQTTNQRSLTGVARIVHPPEI